MRIRTLLLCLLVSSVLTAPIVAADKKMPREDVVEIPAVGEGLCVHNLFQTNMVIQRDKPVIIWGWAAAGEKVTVTFASQQKEATAAADRSWKVEFPAMPANDKPVRMIVKGKDKTLTLENILVGDVWVLGGQSNMEFPITNVEQGRLEIVSANFPNIRILTVPKQKTDKPQKSFPRLFEWSSWSSRHFRKGDWDVCSPETVRELSAIGYVFARRIHMAAKVPIGVIDTSVGGTTVETWTPIEVLKKIDGQETKDKLAEWDKKIAEWDPRADLERRIKGFENWKKNMEKQGRKIPPDRKAPTDLRPGPAFDQNRPGNRYMNMIAPLEGFHVRGAIFHQGFNNALGAGSAGAAMYYQIFGRMITAWRTAFNDPAMPFGIISLCTAGSPQSRDDYLQKMVDDGAYIREVQYRTFLDFYKADDKNVGFASSFDQRRSWYHPQLKVPVGERIAAWALATQYGFEKEIKWKPPMYTEMKVEGGKIILKMDTQVKPIDDAPIAGFAIAGKDRRFQPADAQWLVTGKDRHNRPRTDRKVIVLSSPHVPEPVHFRYAWGRNPMANLKSSDNTDLPFATQRSDDWKMEEIPDKYYANPEATPRDYRRQLRSQVQREMRLMDMERRLKEARAFIEANQEKVEKERKSLDEHKAKQKEKYGGRTK
jgi:sialate O-acetylesterase